MSLSITRRNFLTTAASSLGAAALFPTIAQATTVAGAAAPSNRLNVGLIGVRSMGWNDLSAILENPSARCVALCDVDQETLSQRTAELATKAPLPKDFLACADYRRLLDRKDIDIVLIGTPDHWHCRQFVDACEAGKDIYVQKPLANSIAECDAMVAAARKHKRITQVGQQQRGGKNWHNLIAFLRTGALGRISRVHVWANFSYAALSPTPPPSTPPAGVDYDLWLGPSPKHPFTPQRFHGSWRCFWDHGGGLLTDWGVHLIDIALWGMNVTTLPLRTSAAGGKLASPQGGHETFDTLSVLWQHKDFLMTWENTTTLHRGPFNKGYGLYFQGKNGVLVANREGWEFYSEEDTRPTKQDGDEGASLNVHTKNFLDCVKKRDPRTSCPVETGALCAKYAHLGNISARLGGASLAYDDTAHKFDVSEANAYLRPNYRAPWKFPEV